MPKSSSRCEQRERAGSSSRDARAGERERFDRHRWRLRLRGISDSAARIRRAGQHPDPPSWCFSTRPLKSPARDPQTCFAATHLLRPPLARPQRDIMEVAFPRRSNRRRRNRLLQRSPTTASRSRGQRLNRCVAWKAQAASRPSRAGSGLPHLARRESDGVRARFCRHVPPAYVVPTQRSLRQVAWCSAATSYLRFSNAWHTTDGRPSMRGVPGDPRSGGVVIAVTGVWVRDGATAQDPPALQVELRGVAAPPGG